MASIQQRGKTFQYTISNVINGKNYPIRKGGFRTDKEARIAAAEVEAQMAKGINPYHKKVPFTHYFKEWVVLYKKQQISGVTLAHYEYTLEKISEYFHELPIQKITRRDYQKFLNKLGENKAKETVSKIHGHIKACVKDALEEGYITVDFTRKTVLTWEVEAKKGDEKHLNYEESKLLIKSIWQRINEGLGYLMLLLAINSGMRYEELIALTWHDFDFINHTITVNKTWGYKKNMPSGFGPTKNKQSNRIIKMDGATMQLLKKLYISTPNNPANTNQLVFYSPYSKYQVITNTNVNKLLNKLLNELNLSPLTMHGLRHTHGSILLYKKVSIHYISERLGHADIETTLKTYTHVLTEMRKEEDQLSMKTFAELNNAS